MKRILALLLISGTCFGQYDRGDTFRFVRFIQSNTNAPAEGQIAFLDEQGGLVIGMRGGGLLTLGAELQTTVYNDTGEALSNGVMVAFTGEKQGVTPKAYKISNTDIADNSIIGMVTTEPFIADGGYGEVTTYGIVRGVPYKAGYALKDPLYLDQTEGDFTNIEPQHPLEPFYIGHVYSITGDTMDIYIRMDGWKTWGMLDSQYASKTSTTSQTFTAPVEAPYFLVTATNLYDDLLVPFSSIDLAGLANPPSPVVLFGSIYALAFDDSGNNEIYFTGQLSHAYWPGTGVEPHLHGVSAGTTETSNWELVSTWASVGSTFGTRQTNTFTWVSSGVNGKHELIDCGMLTNTNAAFSSMVGSRLKRLAGGTANDVNIIEADYHYRIRHVPAVEYDH